MKIHKLSSIIFFNLGSRWGEWPTPHPGHFTTGKDPVPVVEEALWVPVPVWTGAENLGPTGIRSPDRPALRGSLYRLRYRGPQVRWRKNVILWMNGDEVIMYYYSEFKNALRNNTLTL
jgi:hypothetical protein